MKANFADSLRRVLAYEGGYVNHPKDPGGATNKGVTLENFRRYVNPTGTVADLIDISPEDVEAVYRDHYWNAVRANDLPSGVDFAVFDFAVNSGPSRAAEFLQAILGVKADGKIGPVTLKAAAAADPKDIINKLCDRRMAWLEKLPTFAVFGKGWASRVSAVRAAALRMAAQPVPAPTPAPDPSQPATGIWGAVVWIVKIILSLIPKRKS